MLYNFYNPNLPAIQAFEDLWKTDRPWILVYHGPSGCGKSPLLSWLAEHQCRGRIPHSLIRLEMYSSDLDAMFIAITESIVSTANFTQSQVDYFVDQLTNKMPAHWVGQGALAAGMKRQPLTFLFDDYQIFESRSTQGGLYHQFLDRIDRAHERLPGLRVVIATREFCRMPVEWFYMQEAAYFRL